jgi:hypothetical protein
MVTASKLRERSKRGTSEMALHSTTKCRPRKLHRRDRRRKNFTSTKGLRKTRARNAVFDRRGQTTHVWRKCLTIPAALLSRDIARFVHEARSRPDAPLAFSLLRRPRRRVPPSSPVRHRVRQCRYRFPPGAPPQIGLEMERSVNEDIVRFGCPTRKVEWRAPAVYGAISPTR